MADYWIKLYHEIIDDPKMATLPDRLWRRTIELFLLAGRLCNDKSGNLPDTRQLAWLLRMSTDDLQTDMDQLAITGIVEAIPGGWLIVNFEKRQRAATSTERVTQHRERKHKQQYNGDETDLKRNVTQINRLTESESETESETENTNSSSGGDFVQLVKAYEQNIAPITQRSGEQLADDLNEYGITLCLDAIGEAVRQNVRKWAYVQGILRRWHNEGRKPPKSAKKKTDQPSISYVDIGEQRHFYQGSELLRIEPIPTGANL